MSYKEFFKYILFNILGMMGLSCYILADTFFVSKALGTDGLASLNFAIPVYNFINGIGLMLGIGGATLFTIQKNQSRPDSSDMTFTYTFFISVFIAVILVLTGCIFSEKLAFLLGANDTTLIMTEKYLKILLCFSPFFIINNILLAFVRNDGSPKMSGAAMIIGSLSNIVLDYLFIFVFRLGITGAALATGAAPVVGILMLLTHFKKGTFKLKPALIFKKSLSLSDNIQTHSAFRNLCYDLKRIFSLGLSSFIIEFSSGIVLIVFNIIIMKINGNTGVAAYGIIANISLVILAVFTGIAQGIQPLASRFYATGNEKEQKKIISISVIISISIALVSYCLLIIFSQEIISVFNSEKNAELTSIAHSGFIMYFSGFIFAGFNIVTTAFMSATQKPREAFILSVFRGFVIIPVVIVFSLIFKINGVWLAFGATELLAAVSAFLLQKKYKKF